MNVEHPERLIVLGVAMMLFGCIAPFLMVVKVWESTFFLNFLSYGMSVLGMAIGFTGMAVMRVKQKRSDDDEDKYR
ncbi:MAG TPA: hypothetical protein PKJ84_09015 [Anaerolineales bacterium]|nr:hypothetical protein [Anaerolineales bacterium]HND47036.1 hypothetical protein [Anaerolineales bacterium]HNE03633.1 hypothetical protein [Anaerolineales bacterium]HNH25561.1 hypothetical protein [Anaerolineales bacterium]HNO94299.1 hypothetical protein [Anaerolineales bacterium]